jgi:ankyrin repeat protein
MSHLKNTPIRNQSDEIDYGLIQEELSSENVSIHELHEYYFEIIKDRSNERNKTLRSIGYYLENSILYSKETKRYIDEIWFSSAKLGLSNFTSSIIKYKNFNINIVDPNKNTAIIIAAQNNRQQVIEKLLEKNNIKINKTNKKGYNAIEIAFISNHNDMVKILRKYGAHPSFLRHPRLWFQIKRGE